MLIYSVWLLWLVVGFQICLYFQAAPIRRYPHLSIKSWGTMVVTEFGYQYISTMTTSGFSFPKMFAPWRYWWTLCNNLSRSFLVSNGFTRFYNVRDCDYSSISPYLRIYVWITKSKGLILVTVFPLISARGAYEIMKWHCLFHLLISAPCSMQD